MSFNSNHINPIITLDNYEEYFILYMDNELDPNQVQMVESFLNEHPRLQLELDMLMETKLPVEEIRFDKSSLFSENMKAPIAEEDLLLFIDNELDSSKKKIVELELASNTKYQQQYQQILRTKLDPLEVIVHPNKKELYRHETRVISMAVWMRIAVALILVAAMTVLYFTSDNNETLPPGSVAVQPVNNQPKENEPSQKVNESVLPATEMAMNKNEEDLPEENSVSNKPSNTGSPAPSRVQEHKVSNELVALHTGNELTDPNVQITSSIQRTSSIETNKQSFNNKLVTVDHVDPYNNITASIQPAVYVENAAGNNDHKKGSLKSFFRKATRIVGQTTGFNASGGGDDEVLIGAVAVKL
jgi:hypothetical protein